MTRHWDFDPAARIRYRTDSEYEEHFRVVFAESVRRRLRSDAPILAELSGGIDSSSIVCMADTIIARDADAFPRLDTLSYYNESEPHWNERPLFHESRRKTRPQRLPHRCRHARILSLRSRGRQIRSNARLRSWTPH